MTDSAKTTRQHIRRVRDLIRQFCIELNLRGTVHDRSKFDPIEKGPLDEMQRLIAEEGQAPFGSDEYERRKRLLGPMLEHHYANNSHHPEHYENGIAGMDLLDLIEMFIDWKAASERGDESAMNLSKLIAAYEIDPMLAQILKNTARNFHWEAK